MQQPLDRDIGRKLIEDIEQLRFQLVEKGMQYGFLHPSVQQDSRDLDKLLLQFYKLEQAVVPLEAKQK
ncbi:aspartyl-phosphate phosphatase Spo0E family protein [Paenibacillus lutrae]|uniref:Spo0E family sporulation regulatory protein-aspartic acid phosphatase n=1 Tax=Paenibacillus lutrae TaxID=2078573 RepID=A0A7X3K191_9BACL|nr:aspartyl-phosphate phosphatase Spo0E family protein [Paenibacillus lutrae]MVP01731.1 Spo0E family sporulation regulatory protein-aspartic acid phosphatase [Paenibacillus lutrae]